jgi:acyl-homoserine-lactone acylase
MAIGVGMFLKTIRVRVVSNLAVLSIFCMAAAVTLGSGCGRILDVAFRKTVEPAVGRVVLDGLSADVTVRRDDLGIPVVEAKNPDDLMFAAGYVMASDRLAQMVAFSLLGQGRLSEMAGDLTLDIDLLVRTLNLAEAARSEYEASSDDFKTMLQSFSRGVNAYIAAHADRLPPDFMLTGYTPEPWKPVNSFYIYYLLNMGLSFNLREEIAYLNVAAKVGPEKAAWLMPVYPDEPLPFAEALRLKDLDFRKIQDDARHLSLMADRFQDLFVPLGIPASNNWAVAPQRTKAKASIIANDMHLAHEHPPVWMLIHLKSPGYEAAGVAVAGIPGIIAGYNGHIAWGMTMVMADTQDLFLEKLDVINDQVHYLHEGSWLPVDERTETFSIKGAPDVVRTIAHTRNGPLLNAALAKKLRHVAMPPPINLPMGLALRSTLGAPGRSMEAMFELNRAADMEDASQAIGGIRSLGLNFIFGNRDHIAWQVSGTYPLRKEASGQLPVPAWTGEHDWIGFVDPKDHPFIMDPEAGYLGTANHRTLPPGHPLNLSSSWASPGRAERMAAVLEAEHQHTWETSMRMQADRHDPLAAKLKDLLFHSAMSEEIYRELEALPDAKRIAAREVLSILGDFDGEMAPESQGAAVYGVFRHVFIHRVFADELGPKDDIAWQSLISALQAIYGADQDHLLGREDSPFWNDTSTPVMETKARIIAESLAETIAVAEKLLGGNREAWAWGRLLTYRWQTQTTRMKPLLPFWKQWAVGLMSRYTDRGPYPAGGNYDTLNVAGYRKGDDFDVWLIPVMRMIVDFGLEEPLFLTSCGGQSGNPASPHYNDGIAVWLEGANRSMPFQEENIRRQYHRVRVLAAGP